MNSKFDSYSIINVKGAKVEELLVWKPSTKEG